MMNARSMCRLRNIHIPFHHIKRELHDRSDNCRAARATRRKGDLTLFFNNHRRHGRKRTFTRRDFVKLAAN